jgi:phosphoribosyl 1,2-cyclic phosphodiesterase
MASMRFRSLGSGSTGNATLVEAGSGPRRTRVLVDCGFTMRELQMRLGVAGLQPADIDAVFITHEHGDHIGCAVTLARKHGVPLYMSRGTWYAIKSPDLSAGVARDGGPLLRFARDGASIEVQGLRLDPYTVPHDAHEPLQLTLTDGVSTLGVLTDAGSITPYLIHRLQNCSALLLECNHDRQMLADSSYPYSLKARVGGRWGHLSNDTSADILTQCLHGGLRHLVAAHLSEQNNRPELAAAALAQAAGTTSDDIVIATPAEGFGWLDLR